jgi:hypothetical protein
MALTPKKRIGRPLKKATPGTRFSLGLKVTADIKTRLDAAAEASGRSQSQEADFRLERSFDRNSLLTEVLTLAYGPRLAGQLMMVGRAMEYADDADHTGAAFMAAITVLMLLAPSRNSPGTEEQSAQEAKIALNAARRAVNALLEDGNNPPSSRGDAALWRAAMRRDPAQERRLRDRLSIMIQHVLTAEPMYRKAIDAVRATIEASEPGKEHPQGKKEGSL